jgi:hypothetical protein
MLLLRKLQSLSHGYQTKKPTIESSVEFLADVLKVRIKIWLMLQHGKVEVTFTPEQTTKV